MMLAGSEWYCTGMYPHILFYDLVSSRENCLRVSGKQVESACGCGTAQHEETELDREALSRNFGSSTTTDDCIFQAEVAF